MWPPKKNYKHMNRAWLRQGGIIKNLNYWIKKLTRVTDQKMEF